MRNQIIMNQLDFDGFGIGRSQSLTEQGIFPSCPPVINLSLLLTSQRLNCRQQGARPQFVMTAILLRHQSENRAVHRCKSPGTVDQKARHKASISVPCGPEIGFLSSRCTRFAWDVAWVRFFRIVATSVCEKWSQYPSSTALSARSRKFHLGYHSGG